MLLNTFYTARRFEEDLKLHQNENLKIQTQILQENSYLRTVCESIPQQSKPQNTSLNLPNLDLFAKLLSSDKEKKHKKTATAIFDDSVCFKINLDDKEDSCEELPEKDTQHTQQSQHTQQLLNTDNSEDRSNNYNQNNQSMLRKLSLYKSKPKLFLFHNQNEDKEDVNNSMSKGISSTQENLVSRNKLLI